MTKKTFFLPDLGEGLPDAEIVEWLAQVGDTVMLDQPLVSMETAKAVVEVPSPFSGKLLRVSGGAGDVITTGAWLVEHHGVADLGQPLDDFGVRQAFTEVGQEKRLLRHDGNAPCCQPAASVRFTAAVILSTLGRYFISSRNRGMWVS